MGDANAVGGFLVINPRAGDARPRPEELGDEAERLGVQAHVLSRGSSIAARGIAGGATSSPGCGRLGSSCSGPARWA